MSGAADIGALSVQLADAALVARERGDDVHAIFFAVKAAETLALAKALGWKPQAPSDVGNAPVTPTVDRGTPKV